MLIHIDKERYNRIAAQGYNLSLAGSLNAPVTPPVASEDVLFHFLNGERGFCVRCGANFDSVVAETPCDIQNIKARMRQGRGPQ